MSSTCWTLIRDAAAGEATSREQFALLYTPVLDAYLKARWQGLALRAEVGDATQEVFVECFREGGALHKVNADRPGGFRAFLYGIARNVARRFEERFARERMRVASETVDLDAFEAREATLSTVFDRAWAEGIMRRAAETLQEEARRAGPEASRRVEILRLRFQEELPIREIAVRLGEDAAKLHHEYARARDEFRSALLKVLSFYHPQSPGAARREAAALVALLE